MGDGFVFLTIFLSCKIQQCLCGRLQQLEFRCSCVVPGRRTKERCILQTERVIVRVTVGVFTGSQQEEEPENCAVSDSARQFIGSIMSRCGGVGHELNRNRLDSLGWRVFICVRLQQSADAAVDITVCISSGVRGPQAGDFLADGA